MKTRAYSIAILGLIILALLYYKSKHMTLNAPIESIESSIEQNNANSLETHGDTIRDENTHEAHNHDHPVEIKSEQAQKLEETMLANERFYTEAEIKEMTRDQFENLLKETEAKLPTVSDIRKLPAEALHHTPLAIIKAGRELGLLKEVINAHEDYELEAMEFYKKCAEKEDSPTPVRALCLTNLIEINKKRGIETNYSKYPSQIIELAKMITDL